MTDQEYEIRKDCLQVLCKSLCTHCSYDVKYPSRLVYIDSIEVFVHRHFNQSFGEVECKAGDVRHIFKNVWGIA